MSQSNSILWSFDVDGKNFDSAGFASQSTKFKLRQLGLNGDIIKRVAIAMYEGEINMVIHAEGGVANVEVDEDKIIITLTDTGKGIADIEQAMREGFSTATEEIRDLGFGAGMGLPNMKKNSDELIIDSAVGKGTKVTMIFAI
ncbi:MAG: ATP-binding protein [Clostridia bacterium]|nr:ATP-binding protein [Clostridia bacterium]